LPRGEMSVIAPSMANEAAMAFSFVSIFKKLYDKFNQYWTKKRRFLAEIAF